MGWIEGEGSACGVGPGDGFLSSGWNEQAYHGGRYREGEWREGKGGRGMSVLEGERMDGGECVCVIPFFLLCACIIFLSLPPPTFNPAFSSVLVLPSVPTPFSLPPPPCPPLLTFLHCLFFSHFYMIIFYLFIFAYLLTVYLVLCLLLSRQVYFACHSVYLVSHRLAFPVTYLE